MTNNLNQKQFYNCSNSSIYSNMNEKNSNSFIESERERERDASFPRMEPRNFVVQLKYGIQPISHQAYFQRSNMETHNEIAFPGQ